MGLVIGFGVVWFLLELMLVHLTLSTAIVAMVAAIEVDLLVSVDGLWQVGEMQNEEGKVGFWQI